MLTRIATNVDPRTEKCWDWTYRKLLQPTWWFRFISEDSYWPPGLKLHVHAYTEPDRRSILLRTLRCWARCREWARLRPTRCRVNCRDNCYPKGDDHYKTETTRPPKLSTTRPPSVSRAPRDVVPRRHLWTLDRFHFDKIAKKLWAKT